MPVTYLPATPRSAVRAAAVGLFLGLMTLVVAGCGARTSQPAPHNLRPHVRLVAGPATGDSVRYNSAFNWYGWDDDGVIDHYQYAIDIPGRFTQDDIDNPLTPDIAWRDTLVTQAGFVFGAARPETLRSAEGNDYGTSRPYGPHTLYLRSVDNEGGVSPAADVSFTAYTILPRATIVGLPRLVPVTLAGRRLADFSVRWTGEDPDRADRPREPAAYDWKLIRLGDVTEPVVPGDIVHGRLGTSFPWHRVRGDVKYLATRLDADVPYLFALRAVDEAGGLEETFVLGRNALVLQARGAAAPSVSPVLMVRLGFLGLFTFPDVGDSVDVQALVAGVRVPLEMIGDARAYGGTISAFRYCFDRPDDAPECNWNYGGWCGWAGPCPSPDPIALRQPGPHHLLVEVRDTQGNRTTGRFAIETLPFPRDRDVLYVDDVRGSLLGADPAFDDAAMDARFMAALHAAGYTQVDRHDVWGAGDVTGVPHPPSLAKLSHYRVVFWSTNGEGGGLTPGVSGLLQSAGCGAGQVLRAYVAAGGALCVSGVGVVGALTPRADGAGGCRFEEDATGAGIVTQGGNFVADFLGSRASRFRRAEPGGAADLLVAAQASGSGTGLPTVPLDAALFPAGGLAGYDAALEMPGPVPGLDTLYVAGVSGAGAPFHGRPIAWRWSETLPGADSHGPVVLFGFPLEALAARPPGGPAGADLEAVMSALAAWFRGR